MGVISLVSCSGAPGVTTVSLATTAALTATSVPEPVMIEMATSGGVVAGQYDLPSEPGLTSLAIALGGEPPDILDHAQELPGGVPVVVAPPSNSKIIKLVEARADPLAHFLADAPVTAIVDCGRISTTTSLQPLLDVSALVGVVIRPSRENFQLAATTMTELNESTTRPTPAGWVIVGPCPWSHDEIVGQYGLPILSVISEDRLGADAVAGLRRLRRRSPLARSVQTFADDIAKHLRIASPTEPLGYLNPADHYGVGEFEAAEYGNTEYEAVEPAELDFDNDASAAHEEGEYADGRHKGYEASVEYDDAEGETSLELPPLPGASVR